MLETIAAMPASVRLGNSVAFMFGSFDFRIFSVPRFFGDVTLEEYDWNLCAMWYISLEQFQAYNMNMLDRKPLKRIAIYTALSDFEKAKAIAIADEMGGVTVSEMLRRLVMDYKLKTPQN
ncbi:MAG: hypothetical protein ACRC62_03830 [Microcoleus sp.]